MLQARFEIGDWEGSSISLGKKLSCEGLQAVINGNEGEMDETGLEVDGKGNGGNSALFNLKGTAILYNLLNLLLWFESLETSIELNIDSASFRCPFSTRCNLSK